MGQLFSSDYHNKVAKCRSLVSMDHFCKEKGHYCKLNSWAFSIVNPSNKDEIIIVSTSYCFNTDAFITRYNFRTGHDTFYGNHILKSIFNLILDAKNIDHDAKIVQEYISDRFTFYKMIKYPFGDNLIMLFGRYYFWPGKSQYFCALIDTTSLGMEVVYLEILSNSIAVCNAYMAAALHKNIMFWLHSKKLLIYLVGQVKYAHNVSDSGCSDHGCDRKLINYHTSIDLSANYDGWAHYHYHQFVIKSVITDATSGIVHVELLIFAPDTYGFHEDVCQFWLLSAWRKIFNYNGTSMSTVWHKCCAKKCDIHV